MHTQSETADLIRRLTDAATLMEQGHAVFVPALLMEATAWIERLQREKRSAQEWDEYHPAYHAGALAALWRRDNPRPIPYSDSFPAPRSTQALGRDMKERTD